eukprot:TRINITY_DN4058_c0_g3_i1.p1 TRINITY_DN4058_c0_g3~~TRINITY_DN4058_c0_g3_i1.p1  ORF type:complete len:1716 (+),score=453.31 TRINITY_DN4058_c0_g3_i1:38-5149(+)
MSAYGDASAESSLEDSAHSESTVSSEEEVKKPKKSTTVTTTNSANSINKATIARKESSYQPHSEEDDDDDDDDEDSLPSSHEDESGEESDKSKDKEEEEKEKEKETVKDKDKEDDTKKKGKEKTATETGETTTTTKKTPTKSTSYLPDEGDTVSSSSSSEDESSSSLSDTPSDHESEEEQEDKEDKEKFRKSRKMRDLAAVNWTEEFQRILAMPDNLQKFNALADLAKDFSSVAKVYGKIIISESSLPYEHKTLKPVRDMGGVAGGDKYVIQGILFKFALDVELAPDVWMYGGSKPNDEKAMKAAAHEKRGLINLFHCHLPGFHCPLMQLIHYRGFCLTAMALLPIGGGTLCYGSDDGGNTVYAHPYVSKVMNYVGKMMKLSKHHVKDKEIIGPGDIEIHVQQGQEPGAKGSKYYFVDAARLFPPEAPSKQDKRAVFYNLLRPEFVKKYKEPLCSDALSNWCVPEEKKAVAKAIKEATKYLIDNVIPDFATLLRNKLMSDCNQLVNTLHDYGINIRHLGRIRALLNAREKKINAPTSLRQPKRPAKPSPMLVPKASGLLVLSSLSNKVTTLNLQQPEIEDASSRLILTELVARTLKNEARALLREKMRSVKIATESPYIHLIHEYLTPILYFTPRGPEYMIKYSDNNNMQVANCPIPSTFQSFYMEFTIIAQESTGGVGLIPASFANNTSGPPTPTSVPNTPTKYVNRQNTSPAVQPKLPDLRGEYSYSLTNDGAIYHSGKPTLFTSQPKGETVIGIYYSPRVKVIIFTMDGQSLGATIPCEPGTYIPIIQGQQLIKTNFGDEKFVFDIESFCKGLRYPLPSFTQEQDVDKRCRKFWTKTLKDQILQRYPLALSDEELMPSISLRDKIDMGIMLQRFQELSGIKLSQRLTISTVSEEKPVEVEIIDILSLKPRVSHLELIDFAEAVSKLIEIEDGGIQDIKAEIAQLQEAEAKIITGISTYEAPDYLYYSGNVYYQLALRHQGEQKQQYLLKAEAQYSKNSTETKKLFSFEDLDQEHLKTHTSSINEIFAKTCFKMGLVILHKGMLQNDEKILESFPNSIVITKAASKFHEAYQIGGYDLLSNHMRNLRQNVYGSTPSAAIQAVIEAQAIKNASQISNYSGSEFWFDLTFITHKTISAISQNHSNSDNWPDSSKNLFTEEKNNFVYLFENHKDVITNYISELFTGGVMGTDIAVLLEMVDRLEGYNLSSIIESTLLTLSQPCTPRVPSSSNVTDAPKFGLKGMRPRTGNTSKEHLPIMKIRLDISNITPLVSRAFKKSKCLKSMPAFSALLDQTNKPLDQQDRLASIEKIVLCYRQYTDSLRRVSNLKADIAAEMDETEFRNLFGSPEIYGISKEWLRRFEEVLSSKVYLCAEVFKVMLATEKSKMNAYGLIPDQMEALHSLSTGPRSKKFLATLRKHNFPLKDLESVLKAPSKIHIELRRLLSDLILYTPREHIEYEQLQLARQQLDEIIKEQKEITDLIEKVRKLTTVASIITGCPFSIISGGQGQSPSSPSIKDLTHSSRTTLTSSNTSLPTKRRSVSVVRFNTTGANDTQVTLPRAYVQHGGLFWWKEQISERKMSSLSFNSVPWKPCILILLNNVLLVTSDQKKLTEDEQIDVFSNKEINDFSYLRKMKDTQQSLQYRYHVDLINVVDIVDHSKQSAGVFGLKLSSGRSILFKGDSKNYRRWIFALNDLHVKRNPADK